jgi:hypothetical protein
MKDLLSKSFLIILAIGLIYFLIMRSCQPQCPPVGHQLVTDQFMDSLIVMANKPPIIEIKDSIVYRDTIIYIIKNVPVPVEINEDLKVYRDSIYNDSIRVWTEISSLGDIVRWDQWYQPIIHYKTKTVKEYVPYPVNNTISEFKNSVYLYGLAGGNFDRSIFGIGSDYNTEKMTYGLQYQRFGTNNLIQAKIGIRIKIKK